MTSQRTARGRFQRAVARGHLLAAETAARELGQLSLGDALALTILLARSGSDRFERAAVRWHGRLSLEAKGLTLADSHLILAALMALRRENEDFAADALGRIARRYGVVATPLPRLSERVDRRMGSGQPHDRRDPAETSRG